MKRNNFLTKRYLTLIGALVLTLSSCDKTIEETERLKPVTIANADVSAGGWKMIVLSSASQIAVATPVPTSSDPYIAEIAAIKDAQSRLTTSQRNAIEFWSAGGVLRWNQLLRKLVAKYNLPPAPRADNSYPVPDAENPFGDPNFPFSNPPYAARAYSYVSVGQYDALKAAWYYKNLYNRVAPYQVDSEVKQLMPATGVSAYPSEDAVLSSVSADMLKSLFPAAVQEITLFAAQQRNAALWSGRASSSDIAAGLALGKAVATAMLARAGNDGMRNAVGNKTQWDAFAQSAKDRGELPWISQEDPARPPMLPNFGQVKGWNMSPADFVKERPEAPPSTSSDKMKTELAEVKHYSEKATRDQLATVYKWADGAGTYTPPGHWNDIAAEYIHTAGFSEVRAARAYALLNMAMHDAAVGCWETKFFYFNPRPSQMDPSIKTLTGLPNFPSFTSGHSTFSAAAATVLSYLFPQGASDFDAMANEAAVSRLYGAIHYRSDIEMGNKHGKTIGNYTVNYALTDGGN